MARKRLNKEKIVNKTAAIAGKTVDALETAADKTEDVVENVVESAKEKVENVMDSAKDKMEEFMNKPEVVEAKEDITNAVEEATETVKTAAKTVRTKVSEVILQYGEDFLIADIEKAVKKDAADKKLKGDIKIYLNLEEKAAYYTVDGKGDETMKVSFSSK